MEHYLRDSPSDNTTSATSQSTTTNTNNNYNDQYKYNPAFESNKPPYDLNFDTNGLDINDFSLNLNYSEYNHANSNNDNSSSQLNQSNYNSNSQLATGDYLSPMGFSYNNPQSSNSNYNTNGNDQNNFSNPGSFNEPFLDDMAFSQAILAPQLSNTQQQNHHLSPQLSPQQNSRSSFVNPMTTSANLDEIISPNNYDEASSFLNPQYFSPPNQKSNFNQLNSIAETSIDNDYNSAYSRHGSISGPSFHQQNFQQFQQPDITTGSYLSPQFNPPSFMSPSSQTENGSYLNSPPTHRHQHLDNLKNQFSSSIPNPSLKAENWNTLSPPPSSAPLSTSVPSGSTPQQKQQQHPTNTSIPTKQLSKEEKLKRRKEFHNAVERRRRDLIKEKIKELGIIVPPSLLNPQLSAVQSLQRKTTTNGDKAIDVSDLNEIISSVKVKETKPNKSTILNKSVDYVNHLNYVLKKQEEAKENLLKQIAYYENELNRDTSYQSQNGMNQNLELNYNPDDFFADLGTSTDNF